MKFKKIYEIIHNNILIVKSINVFTETITFCNQARENNFKFYLTLNYAHIMCSTY